MPAAQWVHAAHRIALLKGMEKWSNFPGQLPYEYALRLSWENHDNKIAIVHGNLRMPNPQRRRRRVGGLGAF